MEGEAASNPGVLGDATHKILSRSPVSLANGHLDPALGSTLTIFLPEQGPSKGKAFANGITIPESIHPSIHPSRICRFGSVLRVLR